MSTGTGGHIKEVEFTKDKWTYVLEVDTEDKDNLVIESVTMIDAPGQRLEHDLDPTVFEEDLDIDDWQRIKEALGDAK